MWVGLGGDRLSAEGIDGELGDIVDDGGAFVEYYGVVVIVAAGAGSADGGELGFDLGGEGAVAFLPAWGESSFTGELFLEAGGQGLGGVVAVDGDYVRGSKIALDTIWATVFGMLVVAFSFVFIFIFSMCGKGERAESNEKDKKEAHIGT